VSEFQGGSNRWRTRRQGTDGEGVRQREYHEWGVDRCTGNRAKGQSLSPLNKREIRKENAPEENDVQERGRVGSIFGQLSSKKSE